MSINFEGFNRYSPETLDERVIMEAFKKAEEKVRKERIQIDPKKFTDYSPKDIQADLDYVSKREREIRETDTPETIEARRLSTILEEILVDQIELNYWLGPKATTRKSSKFDDLANGVDEIVETDPASSSYLALAIDVTYSSARVKGKLRDIRNKIDSGDLATIKYFESNDETMRGRLLKVPHVIIGISRKTISELAKLWLERDNEALSAHPVQLEILDEIHGQLNAFRDYAEKQNQADLVKIYDRQIAIIQKIRSAEDRVALRKTADLSYRTEDPVFLELKKELNAFGR